MIRMWSPRAPSAHGRRSNICCELCVCPESGLSKRAQYRFARVGRVVAGVLGGPRLPAIFMVPAGHHVIPPTCNFGVSEVIRAETFLADDAWQCLPIPPALCG